jgi:predicted ATPase
VTRGSGYVLLLRAGELDSARFERLLDDGRLALAAGNAPRARRALRQALALWRGPALGEFAYDDFARAEAERLEELRLAALEERIEADLALGDGERLIPELRARMERYPLRERAWGQLMLALYRAGRQAEALECFAEARRVLVEGLGLEPGEELRRLQAAILQQDPALALGRRADGRRTNLPAPLGPLVGREHALAEISALLRSGRLRLLTLTGAGGSGKTRLAIEAARALLDEFANGVFLVELAPLQDPALVPLLIASAVGVKPRPGEPLQQALRQRLADEELLLVVDNAEHLAGVGPLLVELLESAPYLKAMVTSRAVLHVSGEQVYPVAPLERDAAAELFVVRAQAADPTFKPRAADARLVAALCERLDRLPLALELAAPRIRTLTLEALHARLAERLPILTGGPRDLPMRQQTLRATLDWSHRLLTPGERQLFRRLSVFAGSFTHEAAEAVSGADLATLDALVEQSLVSRVGDVRLVLLETVREYARELLEESGERAEVQERHARYLLGLAQSANLTIEAEGPMKHELVIAERDNIRAALDWAHSSGKTELGLELAVALENYWVTSGSPEEGRRRLVALLGSAAPVSPEVHAHAVRALGNVNVILGRLEEGRNDFEASLDEYRLLGDERGVAVVLHRLATQELRRGDLERARALAEESLHLSRELGFVKSEAVALGQLATVEVAAGADDRALALLVRSAERCAATGFLWYQARMLMTIARLLLRRDQVDEARERLREAVALLRRMDDVPGSIHALALFVQIAVRNGDYAAAGRVVGAIEAEEMRGRHGQWEQIRSGLEDDLRTAAGPSFHGGREIGRRLTFAQAIEDALEHGPAAV